MNLIFNLLASKGNPAVALLICLLVVAIGVIVICAVAYFQKKATPDKTELTATEENKTDKTDDNKNLKPEGEIRQIHIDSETARKDAHENFTQQQVPVPPQQPAVQAQPKNGGGFLKFLGIVFLIILIVGGIVFAAKCVINEASDGEINKDGNPVLLNRAATLNDFTLTESVEATITNLKESYILVPNVDIKNLEITFKYYDSNKKLITTKTKNIGNVTKSSEYTVSVSHSLTEIFQISTVSYYVTGGTVSYFS